ncbi:MAG TPA: Tim44-like domain-containing protein, partial [Casimicrobiaceae bacterium]|nr:Tim44-like domain-containing protein [Casimicrobiaceae bacterium]
LGSLLLIGLLAVGAIMLFRAFAARSARPAGPQYAAAGAGARPPLQTTTREPAFGTQWGANDATPAANRFPPGFDPAPFVEQAKQQFHRLQSAYDRGDRALLADVTTPEMHAEIVRELTTRGAHQPTEVATLDADVVEVVREGDQYIASVRFHGAVREDGARDPHPFEELWHLVKPVDGSSGWLLAGIQQAGAPALA